ncbi:MAG: nucleoside monophosphate kinase [Candidatus Taylorbacteria bacterium]|nr:nucleoside monophosphate kinase [Candidatus Taylorbacteria bacterium]
MNEVKKYVVELLGWNEEAVRSLSGDRKKWIIVLIGPPGSGKGTQADLLAEKFGLVHFETSKVLDEKLNNADPNDEILMREKKIRASGELNSPELVVEWALEKIRELAKKGLGLVFSGSPRTIYEAEHEMPALEELYGKGNIKVIHLNLTKEESVKRNSSRRICKASRHSIPDFPMFKDIKTCPKDGSELITQNFDTPETISVRYEVYLRRTQPILSFLQERGHNVMEVEGEQDIDKVFEDILAEISKS